MKKRHNGFTLVEVILVIALMGVVTAVSYSIFFTGQKSFKVGSDKSLEQADNRILREYLTKELRYASYISNEKPDESKFINNVHYSLAISEVDNVYTLEKKKYSGNIGSNIYKKTFKLNLDEKSDKEKLQIQLEDEVLKRHKVINVLPYGKESIYDFTIMLENELLESLKNNSNLADNIIYYTYPEYITAKNESGDVAAGGAGNDSNDGGNKNDNQLNPPDNLPDNDTYPEWDGKKAYQGGNIVSHNGRMFQAHYYTENDIPGLIKSPWQELTNEWRSFNIYKKGDTVFYNGKQFKCRENTKETIPGLMNSPWQELTDEWRNFNIYTGGDIVKFNNNRYKAKWHSENDIPTAGDPWEKLK